MIPLISAVGHETDWTLIDHAADVRAPTPTGAAEIAVPVKADLEATVAQLGARLGSGIGRLADRKREALRAARRGMPAPDGLLAMPRQRFDAAEFRLGHGLRAGVAARRNAYEVLGSRLSPNRLSALLDRDRTAYRQSARDLPRALENVVTRQQEMLSSRGSRLSIAGVERQGRTAGEQLSMLSSRLVRAIGNQVVSARSGLEQKERLLKSLSYEAVLERGFALVRDEGGHAIKRAAEVRKGASLTIEFAGRERIAAVATGPARTRGPILGDTQAKRMTMTHNLYATITLYTDISTIPI